MLREKIKKLFNRLSPCRFSNPLCKDSLFGCQCGTWGMVAIAAATVGTGVYVSRQQKKAQSQAIQAAERQSAAQLEVAEKAQETAKMTPEERAYMSMLRGRAEAGLGAPEFETTTAQETESALEALQKYYMTRGFQPSPAQTGLLIEPSQKIARDVAIQNALLRRQAQQQAWERAYQVAPMSQELMERGAGLQALPYETQAAGVPGVAQQQLALQQMETAGASQEALMNLAGRYIAYQSPLFQQRIAQPGGASIIPETYRSATSLKASPYYPS